MTPDIYVTSIEMHCACGAARSINKTGFELKNNKIQNRHTYALNICLLMFIKLLPVASESS